MATAKIVYYWRRRASLKVGIPHVLEVAWRMVGGNGEIMCGSGAEGYRDRSMARRAVKRICHLLGGSLDDTITVGSLVEEGPGHKPKE